MKQRKRFMAMFIAIAVVLSTVSPLSTKRADAASLSMSKLTTGVTLTLGSHTKTSTWWKFKIAGTEAFCFDFGKHASPGRTVNPWEHDTFGTSVVWNQDTGGNGGLFAKIFYWLKSVQSTGTEKNRTIFAQALIWSIRSGYNSEAQLKNTIAQIQASGKSGALFTKNVAELYNEIFKTAETFKVTASFWQQGSGGAAWQKFITFDVTDTPNKVVYHHTSDSASQPYRQRINIQKLDENGNVVPGVSFKLTLQDNSDMSVSSYCTRDANNNGTEIEMEPDGSDVSFDGVTNADGSIGWRFTYHLVSEEWGWITDYDGSSTEALMKAIEKLAASGVNYSTEDVLSESVARAAMQAEIDAAFTQISHTYTLTETDVGSNTHLTKNGSVAITYYNNGVAKTETYTNRDLANGINLTLTSGDSWTKDASGNWPDAGMSSYTKGTSATVTDNLKKYTATVCKKSLDGKVYGDAKLKGAVYGVYSDAACTTEIARYVTDADGRFETGYLNCSQTYYIKEIFAPEGFLLNDRVDILTQGGDPYTNEYNGGVAEIDVWETPIKAPIELHKDYAAETNDGEFYELKPEVGAKFQIYLKSKGSYAACSEEERQTITTDTDGNAKSKNLPYGTYVIHQISSGDQDTFFIKDQEVTIYKDSEPVKVSYINELYKAYLKIVKQDGDTQETVLKPGFTYQIYKIMEDGTQELVTQSYRDKDGQHEINEFVTDESGQIMTKKPLASGTYRIYETKTGEGFVLGNENYKYLEIKIGSDNAENCETLEVDGITYHCFTVYDNNSEQKGKFSLYKKGEVLTGYNAEKGEFIYSADCLKGAKFKIYAEGDIITQDGKGTIRFRDKELVATITSGVEAEFTKDYKELTQWEVKEGKVTLTLPIGKYKVVEEETVYGYVLPKDREWHVAFHADSSGKEYVKNNTNDTDADGKLKVDADGLLNAFNDRAKPSISLLKTDARTSNSVAGAVFGIFTADNIYSSSGEVLVKAGEMITKMTTDAGGKAECNKELPLMDEGYTQDTKEKLNSGRYYFQELSVSGSYLLNANKHILRLQYINQETPVVREEVKLSNQQTDVQISKLALATGKEVAGCALKLVDKDGKKIISWISGEETSIKTAEDLTELGYQNFNAQMDKNGNVNIYGLLQEQEYTLIETKPADGYVTAEKIIFMVKNGTKTLPENTSGSAITANAAATQEQTVNTEVHIKNSDGIFDKAENNKISMYDDVTKIRFKKVDSETGKLLEGAKIKILDSAGKKILSFITSADKAYLIKGVLKVGETYTFVETKAPENYEIAKSIKFKVKDSGEIQLVIMKDKYIPGRIITSTPDDFPGGSGTSPKTGYDALMLVLTGLMLLSAAILAVLSRKKHTGCHKWQRCHKWHLPKIPMKMLKSLFFLFFVTLLGSTVIAGEADAKTITKTLEYESKNPEEKAEDSFKKEIKESSKKYKLKNITYKILSEEDVTKEVIVTREVKSKVIKNGKSYAPAETKMIDGTEYQLKSTSQKKVTLKEGYSQTVHGWQEYGTREEAENAPATKMVTATDKKTGKTIKLLCGNKTITKRTATRWEDSYINIRFISYDADTFQWRGLTVEKNEKNPLKGYEQELLESVAGDGAGWELENIRWTGKAYRNEEGVLCRDARAAVRKRTDRYRVSYQGVKRTEAKKGTVYTSTYEGINEVPTGEKLYTIQAAAEYEEKPIPVPVVVGITVGILFLVILVVGIIFIIRKKGGTKREEQI